MSDVYEALDEQTGRTVALKLVRSDDPEFVRRLTQEARALERFEHPGLIRLLDTGLVGGEAYLVMEFIDGPTLAQSLRGGPLGAHATAVLGARLADALSYVHERGVVHRDVKPSNILRSTNGDAWLGDFGIAQLHDATTLTAVGTTLGTVVYMAPEQLEGHHVGPSADIWSLGVVLLECLTGQRVYEGSPSEIVARRMAGPVPLPADLPAPWRLLFNGMLDHQPEQRLDGVQVAALLSSPVYSTPWQPSSRDVTESLAAVAADDRTSLMPGVVAPMGEAGENTLIASAVRRSTATRLTRRGWLVGSGLAAAAAAVIVALIFLLGTSPQSPPTTTTTHATTTTTTTSTTTTTIPTDSSALTSLVSDLTSGQSAGDIDNGSAQAVSQQAGNALLDEAAGNSTMAANDLQQAATTIANGVQSGLISESEGSTLQDDLTNLAAALGVTAPSSTTTTTPGPPGNPGHGHGNGHGNGPGH
jgi:serine/threonine protein kinase